MWFTDRPGIEFKVACDVLESVNFAEIHEFYDVTGNFELDFRTVLSDSATLSNLNAS